MKESCNDIKQMASYEYQKDIYAWIYYDFISTVSNGRPKENIFSKVVFFF